MKYLLISVCELEIETELFKTHEDAYAEMRDQFIAAYDEDIDDIDELDEDEADAEICDWNAYVCDGKNHDNYSWRIVAID